VTGTVDGETRPAGRTLTAPEDPSHAGRTDKAPRLSVDGFDGPLDGLLEMARAHKIDLASLSIAALVEAFAAALEAALADRAGARLEHWAVWTVTAATLTELWSRLMLPPETSEARAAAAEAEALREQIASRARMQVTADWLDRRVQLGQNVFRRGRPEASLSVRGGDLTELLRACLVALRVPEDQAVALRPRPPPLWTAGDAIRRILRLLPGLPSPVRWRPSCRRSTAADRKGCCVAVLRLPASCSPVWNWPATVRWCWIRMRTGCRSGSPAARTAILPRVTLQRRRDHRSG